MAEHEVTYDAERRSGACSCGAWRCYDVSEVECGRLARAHLGREAARARIASERCAALDAAARRAEHLGEPRGIFEAVAPQRDEVVAAAERILRDAAGEA